MGARVLTRQVSSDGSFQVFSRLDRVGLENDKENMSVEPSIMQVLWRLGAGHKDAIKKLESDISGCHAVIKEQFLEKSFILHKYKSHIRALVRVETSSEMAEHTHIADERQESDHD